MKTEHCDEHVVRPVVAFPSINPVLLCHGSQLQCTQTSSSSVSFCWTWRHSIGTADSVFLWEFSVPRNHIHLNVVIASPMRSTPDSFPCAEEVQGCQNGMLFFFPEIRFSSNSDFKFLGFPAVFQSTQQVIQLDQRCLKRNNIKAKLEQRTIECRAQKKVGKDNFNVDARMPFLLHLLLKPMPQRKKYFLGKQSGSMAQRSFFSSFVGDDQVRGCIVKQKHVFKDHNIVN